MNHLDQTIRDCQRGNPLAWETLINGFQQKVYSVAYYYLRNQQEAEDVTQETFIKVYRMLKTFNADGSAFQPWLLTIAKNSCVDRLRRLKTRQQYEAYPPEVETEDEAGGPADRVNEDQRRDLIYRAMDQVESEYREVLFFKHIQGLRNEDIARILALPVGTVKSRANRARLKLAKLLSATGQLSPAPSDQVS